MDRKIMSVEDVAQYFGLHKDTVYEWVKENKIPSIRIGGRIFFLPEVLEEWLRNHLVDG